jgi:hypothetical protein
MPRRRFGLVTLAVPVTALTLLRWLELFAGLPTQADTLCTRPGGFGCLAAIGDAPTNSPTLDGTAGGEGTHPDKQEATKLIKK